MRQSTAFKRSGGESGIRTAGCLFECASCTFQIPTTAIIAAAAIPHYTILHHGRIDHPAR